jgi:predicted ATPase/Flp pilus assembly protein TadD
MTPWRLFLLGGFRLERSGETLTRLRTQKTVALLAWLALHPHREHGREELIERFWPESDLEQGRASLRVALNALRKALEPPPTPASSVLVTSRTHVKIRPEALTTDVAAFEAALKRKDTAEAQRLYVGPLLPGYYDEWILTEQERLAALLPPSSPPSEEPASRATPSQKLPNEGWGLGTSNLPLTLTRFFGREGERERLSQLLTDPTLRLVTLTGPGGTGKTRLALETAGQCQADFLGGTWFVALAETQDAQRIIEGLRDALSLPRSGDARESVRACLESKPTLVILDNLEQLVDSAALILPRLLAQLPTVRFLLTSRIRLGLPGEHVFPIAALPLPSPAASLESLAGNAALALFCDRARAALPEFGLTMRNATALAQLCRQLEGVPLALELAASWAGQLTPKQMQQRFTAALALEGRHADREARHLSVRAALRWSLELLPPELCALFAQLSVFRGGFTLAAAEAVCLAPATSFALNRLREHSLLGVDLFGDVPRFRMLETVREFASECLGESHHALCQRHAQWLLSLEAQSVSEVLAERENCEAALEFLESQCPETALQLTANQVRGWQQAGLFDAGIATLERVLALFPGDPPTPELGLSLAGLAALYFYRGELTKAKHCFERRLTVAEALNDLPAQAEAQRNLGTLAIAEGNYVAARASLSAALQNLPTSRPTLVEILLRSNLGVVSYALGERDTAKEHFRAGIALGESVGEVRWVVNCWHGLGAIATDMGDAAEAERCHRQGLALSRQSEEPLLIGDGLTLVATSQIAAGNLHEAAQMLQEAASLFAQSHSYDMERRLGDEVARLLLHVKRPEQAALLLGYAEQVIETHQLHLFSSAQRDRAHIHAQLQEALAPELASQVLAAGKQLTREAFFAQVEQALGFVLARCSESGAPQLVREA